MEVFKRTIERNAWSEPSAFQKLRSDRLSDYVPKAHRALGSQLPRDLKKKGSNNLLALLALPSKEVMVTLPLSGSLIS